ncbi:MAG: ABC-type cobalamin/Fe3+-siderophore transport system ATPase component [Nitrospirae bacterium]|nr:MAG: ABC-type cobalamin/Fe3+-siderophore transport system ATPase component [Nitrospirota bacterium]
MLSIENLTFRHARAAADVIHRVTFEADAGAITTILGPNGSGKTTIFRCIAGLWTVQQGSVRFGGRELTALSAHNRARLIAVVPQDHEPPFPYSVFDIVLMGRASHVAMFSAPSESDLTAARDAIESVGIAHLAERPYTKISGGERQLVLIARALAQHSPVLILDEPTSHLDFRNQLLVLEKVRSIVIEKKLTALMTLHDPNLAMLFSHKVILVSEGRILDSGSPEAVITARNLHAMYGIDVSVVINNGVGFICPNITHPVSEALQ